VRKLTSLRQGYGGPPELQRRRKLARYFAAGFEAGGNGLGTRLAIAGIVLRYA
jgi:hypothetical protein